MIGILGGTFDPVHIGHLRVAIEAIEKHHLTSVKFLPCKIPVHKNPPHASIEHRINMLTLAIQSEKKFSLDLTEINRHTPSYMIDTVNTLHQNRLHTAPALGLIIGSDMEENFQHWKNHEAILTIAKLLVMPRYLAISSSDIRQKLASGKNIAFLLPAPVEQYIEKNNLYQNS